MIDVRAGRRARAHIEHYGIEPADVACVPAAAGGPKGLALLPLDRLLSEWLAATTPLELVGASIGAWRMAALAQPDPIAALDRLQRAYVFEQRYRHRPAASEVSERCSAIVDAVLGGAPLVTRPGIALSVITARARGSLAGRDSAIAFARTACVNALSRGWLARHFERIIFGTGRSALFAEPFDEFGNRRIEFDPTNQQSGLLASGTIPLVAAAVRSIPSAPPGHYWDGALIDYHLHLPYDRLSRAGAAPRGRVVLYPHFDSRLVAGWLDKHLPWRRLITGHAWLEDVVLICPSAEFIATLPNGRLPSREDFYRYGSDHAGRENAWIRAIGECERFATATLEWLERPNPASIRPL